MFSRYLGTFVLVLAIATSCAAEDIGPGMELFRKSVDKDNSIVVVQRGFPASLKSLFNQESEPPVDRIYQISVELHRQSTPPIVLATKLHGERDVDPVGKGFHILGMYKEDGYIFFTVATGPDLALWKVDPLEKSTWVTLVGWQVAANERRAEPENFRINVAHVDHQRLKITIQIVSTEEIPLTIFEQKGRLWEFTATQSAFDLMFKPATRGSEKG